MKTVSRMIFCFLMMGASITNAQMKDRKETSIIVIHHSATESGNAEIFRRFHKEEREWDDIGYHFVITNGKGGPDGEIQIGRHLQKQGAHVKGKNHNSVGICLVGNGKFTEAQERMLACLIAALCSYYDIEPSKKTIQPHHERCPGKDIDISQIVRKSKEYLEYLN